MAFSLFNPIKEPLDTFDFLQIDRLFVENRLREWFGVQKNDGSTFTELKDFFQEDYIEIQISAFFWGLDTVPETLNFEWINKLHELSVKTLLHESGTPISHTVRTDLSQLSFPSNFGSLLLGSSAKASPEGIASLGNELMDADDEEIGEKACFFVTQLDKNSDSNQFEIIVIDADTARKYYEKQKILIDESRDFLEKWFDQIHIHPAVVFSSHDELHETALAKALADGVKKILAAGLSPILQGVGYVMMNKNPFVIREKAERIINDYNQSRKQTEDEKVDSILHLVKKILNLHIWNDGNGRLCAHQLLNILLIKNGLCPTFLDNNCLDAFTHEELKARVIKGMRLYKMECGNEPGQLKRYRYLNILPLTKTSDFANAIINNNIDVAKRCVEEMTEMTGEDLSFFVSCRYARIDWINPSLWNFNAHFCNMLILRCVEFANKKLLLDVLQHCLKKNITVYETTFDECLCYFNLEMFELFQNITEKQMLTQFKNKMIFDCIPHYRYPEVALHAINYCFTMRNFNADTTDYFIQNLFQCQQPKVIMKFMEQDVAKEICIASNPALVKSLINIMMERIDLYYDEKNKLLSTISPDLHLSHIDPLTNFIGLLKNKYSFH